MLIKIGNVILDREEVKYAYWNGEKLLIGIGVHTFETTGDEAHRIWDELGGNEVKEEQGKWK